MQSDLDIDRHENSGGVESAEIDAGGTKPTIAKLFGGAKPNVAGGASKDKRHDAPIDPAKSAGGRYKNRKPYGPRAPKPAKDAAGPAEETILSVKAPPPPPPPAPIPKAEDVEGWAGLLYLGHALGAGLLKIPELALAKGDAKELAVASMNVMRHYQSSILSEKTQDWIKLAMVAGAIYVPRMSASAARVRTSKAAKGPPPGMNAAGGFDRPSAPSPGNLADCPTAVGAEAFDRPEDAED